ncbi:breast cancer anti-estrogen resistance protein 3 homolog [Bombina bombina]|uniref:breast cancer anti-estrogen resistance protein 3 homolog n=1 Tax=Bombina bombina TaxID=8345 RepID=UPI00235AF536|nr:breast cancer anti-estrogen resistance protein 3 homolog [Bombina bombina]
MSSPGETLKKKLEEELKLNSEDLRSHAWYHGPLQRQEAEQLLQLDGDFLIRDSLSAPGNFVLSCAKSGQVLHFKIIAVTLRPRRGISPIRYQLEQDQFDSIPALVRSYVGDRRPVSDTSGAVIIRPITRTLPLSLLQEKHEARERDRDHRRSLYVSDNNLLRNKDRFGSQPGNLDTLRDRPLQSAQSDSNLLSATPAEASLVNQEQVTVPLSPIFRTGSDPVLRAKGFPHPTLDAAGSTALRGSDGQLHCKAPPKPLRAPSILYPEPSEEADAYSELIPRAPTTLRRQADSLKVEERWRNRIRATETTFGFLDSEISPKEYNVGLENEEALNSVTVNSMVNLPVVDDEDNCFVRPQIQTTSSFQPKNFSSILLSPDNKPLEPNALRRLKEIVSQSDCRKSALHILREDCKEMRIWGVSPEEQQLMGVQSGLELVTLPYGQQLRRDLLERHHLLSLGVAVDILGCTGAVVERANTLHRIIQLAVELRDFAGDLFAFSAVMKALTLPQVTRLEHTWQTLRENYTQSAISFQKHLKPALMELDECISLPPSNGIVVPHILPVLRAMEGELDWGGPVEDSCGRLLRVLQAARSYATNAEVHRNNAETKLGGFEPHPELREAFQTEFSMRLFWGSKGVGVEQSERYKKFDQILTVLSQKLEPDSERRKTLSPVYGTVR